MTRVRGLRLSPTLLLPLDAATGTFGVLATKGAGKSNAAVVMAEQMYDAGIPWVAVDPKGDWHGIRSSADGTGAGLPVVVFGGRHGDVPLEPTAGALIAELVLKHRLTCVLDVSQFTKAETTRFLLAFGRYLFAHADDDGAEPLHLFLEEAHEYLPQVVKGDVAENVSVWQRIVKQGRFKGLGVTLISQRSSVLNKDVLELIDTLIVLRTIGPRSRQSIKEWVHDQDVDAGLLASLPKLADGEAWVWSPGALGILERVQFARRRTFDSGATPKVGEKRRQIGTVADIDLGAIREAMAETIEKAKANDPKELRTRVAALTREVSRLEDELTRERSRIAEPAEPVRVEVPVVPPALADAVTAAIPSVDALASTLTEVCEALARHRAEPVATPARPSRPKPFLMDPEPTRTKSAPAAVKVPDAVPTGGLSPSEQKVLDAVAWLNAVGFATPSKVQVGFVAGYRVGKAVGGRYGNVLGALRSAGLLGYPSPGTVGLTAAGKQAANPPDVTPTTEGLQAAILARLDGSEQRVLRVLIDAYPEPMSKRDVGAAAGYEVGPAIGGRFGNVLGKLRSFGLIDYPAAGQAVALPVLFAR